MRRWLAHSSELLNNPKTPLRRPLEPTFEDFEDFEELSHKSVRRAEEIAERAALVEFDAGVPREWAEGFARLDRSAPPRGFAIQRWAQVVDDGGRFLDRWAGKAAALGWDVPSIFGVDPRAPAWRLDHAGLVVLISGAEVSAISSKSAILRLPTGATQVYRRQDAPGAVPLWVLE